MKRAARAALDFVMPYFLLFFFFFADFFALRFLAICFSPSKVEDERLSRTPSEPLSIHRACNVTHS